jgi:hypothetical protein
VAELEEVFSKECDRTRAFQLLEEIKGCLISLLFETGDLSPSGRAPRGGKSKELSEPGTFPTVGR